jgi:hypothetical protein
METNKVKLLYDITLSKHFISAKNVFGAEKVKSTYVFCQEDTLEIAIVCIFCKPGSGETQHIIFASKDNTVAQKTKVNGFSVNNKKQTVISCESELVIPKELVQSSIVVFVPALVVKVGDRLAYFAPDCEISNTNYEKVGAFSSEPKYVDVEELHSHICRHIGSGTTDVLTNYKYEMAMLNTPIPEDVTIGEYTGPEFTDDEALSNRLKSLHSEIFNSLSNELTLTVDAKSNGSTKSLLTDEKSGIKIFLENNESGFVLGEIIFPDRKSKIKIEPDSDDSMVFVESTIAAIKEANNELFDQEDTEESDEDEEESEAEDEEEPEEPEENDYPHNLTGEI